MLKTKEFIKEVRSLGLEIAESLYEISIYDGNDELAYIRKDKRFYVCTYFEFSEYLSEELQEKLYNLIDKYARTPLEEREEQERFYLKFAALTDNGDETYLNYYEADDSLGMFTRYQEFGFQTRFTQKEINDIRRKFGVTLSDFEQIPVDEYCEEDED